MVFIDDEPELANETSSQSWATEPNSLAAGFSSACSVSTFHREMHGYTSLMVLQTHLFEFLNISQSLGTTFDVADVIHFNRLPEYTDQAQQ